MTLYEAVKEWLKYEPFEYLMRLDDEFHSISVRRRGLEKYDLSLQTGDNYITYTGVVVGTINENHRWVRIRGKYFYPHDPLFFDKMERELADTSVDPEKGWSSDPD